MAIQVLSDVTPNSSDKSLTIGLGSDVRLIVGHMQYTASATAGNRRIELRIKDSDGNNIYRIVAPADQAASSTNDYSWGAGMQQLTTFASLSNMALPNNFTIGPGWTIQILDRNAVDAAADDMNIFFLVEKV